MQYDYFIKDIDLGVESVIGTVVIFLVVLTYTRIFGLKSFSKMTGFDFVNTIIIGNVAGMSICTGRPGLVMGCVILALVYLLNYLITNLRYKSDTVEEFITNAPILLMRNGEMLLENMEKSKVTISELRGKLREANVLRLSQAKAVILETTGDVSVLHESDESKEIDSWLLDGVDGKN